MLYLMIIWKLDAKLNFWSFKSMTGHTEIWSAYDMNAVQWQSYEELM